MLATSRRVMRGESGGRGSSQKYRHEDGCRKNHSNTFQETSPPFPCKNSANAKQGCQGLKEQKRLHLCDGATPSPLFTENPRRLILGNWASGIADSRNLRGY